MGDPASASEERPVGRSQRLPWRRPLWVAITVLVGPALVLLVLPPPVRWRAFAHRPYWFAALGLTSALLAGLGERVIRRQWRGAGVWVLAGLAAALLVVGQYSAVPIAVGELWLCRQDVPADVRTIALDVRREAGGLREHHNSLVWSPDASPPTVQLARLLGVQPQEAGDPEGARRGWETSRAWEIVNGAALPVAPSPLVTPHSEPTYAPVEHIPRGPLLPLTGKWPEGCAFGQHYIMYIPAPDGSPGRRVASAAGHVEYPYLSPNGRWIIYFVSGWLVPVERTMVADTQTGRVFPISPLGSTGALYSDRCFSPEETAVAVWCGYEEGDEACVIVLPGTQ